MQKREALHDRIYKQLLSQIYEGDLPFNSSLPAIRELRSIYGVSDNCMRAALRRLKDEGCISTARGRAARVSLNIDTDLVCAFTYNKETLYSFYEAIRILFPSLYTFAALSCDQQQLRELAGIVEKLPAPNSTAEQCITLCIQFYKTTFSALRNKLIVYIVTTVMQNTILPAMLVQRQSRSLGAEFLQLSDGMRSVYAAIYKGDDAEIKHCWSVLLSATEAMAKKCVKSCRSLPIKEHGGKAGLEYTNEFKYMLIANDIYQKILEGEYAVGSFLPTIEQSQKKYKAASVTIRSTYRILGEVGLTVTENGRGTRVIGLVLRVGSLFDEAKSAGRRAAYLETIEFLQIVCGDLIKNCTLPIPALREELEGPLNPSHRYSGIILCRNIMKATTTTALDIFFQRISTHLFWGTFGKQPPDSEISTAVKHRFCLDISDALERTDTERAILLVREFLAALRRSADTAAS